MTAKVVSRIADINAAEWDACANPDPAVFNPFVTHAFLQALENAQTVGGRTGWVPHHIVVSDDAGRVAACLPCYGKRHSRGEFVYDDAWAEAYEGAGGRYYPKLLVGVPFTPVPGPRLLVRPGPESSTCFERLAASLIACVERSALSSAHVTFMGEADARRLERLGFLMRQGQQFHWMNRGYTSFSDFLDTLASRKRKALRKERAEALSTGLVIEQVTGSAITEAHWDAMFGFYMDTGNRKWGQPYLNRPFFSLLGEVLADRCLLIMVKRGATYIAGALNLIGGDCLYGRYWGAIETHPFLHFEVCYYQAIDYAIAHGLARVEAGAQGEHKLARGYLPTSTWSVHWIRDPHFRAAVAASLQRECRHVDAYFEVLRDLGPYRKDVLDEM